MNLHNSKHGIRKPDRHNNALRAVEAQFAVWQQTLEQEQQHQQEIIEHNLVLSEFLYTQERLQAVFDKHQRWIAAGGDTADQQQTHAPDTSTAWQRISNPAMIPGSDPHWVVHLLETATWEQLQQALCMSCDDWLAYQQQYCSQLTVLTEVSKRCPEMQSCMLEGIKDSIPARTIPAVYDSTSSNIASGSAASGSSSSPLAYDAIVHLLKTTGILMYLALLHGRTALFEAASRNMHTGKVCLAPPVHWGTVAQRMQFSRQQKLHFKLALQNFARQCRALEAHGMSVLQETPSYAFLLACEDIAARNSSSSEEGSKASDPTPAAPPSSSNIAAVPVNSSQTGTGTATNTDASGGKDVAGTAAACAAAAAAGIGNRGAGTAPGSGRPAATAWSPTPAARGSGSMTVATPGSGSGATAAAAATPVGSGSVGAWGDATLGAGPALQDLPPLLTQEAVAAADGPSSPTKELNRNLGSYYQHNMMFHIFLADTLTLEQALCLNVASYPFWPMLSCVVEAALQLPDTGSISSEEEQQQQQDVQLLMSQRRKFMQHAHYQWWNDYGKPDGAPPPL